MVWWVCSESFRRIHYIIVADSSQLILALPCARHSSVVKLFASGSIRIRLLILSLSLQVTGCSHNSLGLIKTSRSTWGEKLFISQVGQNVLLLFDYNGEWTLTPFISMCEWFHSSQLFWINRHLLMVGLCSSHQSMTTDPMFNITNWSLCCLYLHHSAPLGPSLSLRCQKLLDCLQHCSVSFLPCYCGHVGGKKPSSVYWWVCVWPYWTKRTR